MTKRKALTAIPIPWTLSGNEAGGAHAGKHHRLDTGTVLTSPADQQQAGRRRFDRRTPLTGRGPIDIAVPCPGIAGERLRTGGLPVKDMLAQVGDYGFRRIYQTPGEGFL